MDTVYWHSKMQFQKLICTWFFSVIDQNVLEMTEKNQVISVRNIWKQRLKTFLYDEFECNCDTTDRNVSVTKMSQLQMTKMFRWKNKRFVLVLRQCGWSFTIIPKQFCVVQLLFHCKLFRKFLPVLFHSSKSDYISI